MIFLPTANPADLLSKIKQAIDNKHVKGWSYDVEGDFTSEIEIWNQKAWLRPLLEEQCLKMFIVPPQEFDISGAAYAVYHGRFIEMVLRHFDREIQGQVAVSPLPILPDRVSASADP